MRDKDKMKNKNQLEELLELDDNRSLGEVKTPAGLVK